jgi:signal transduction histidine kinase/CheY-like chemotaxis protein
METRLDEQILNAIATDAANVCNALDVAINLVEDNSLRTRGRFGPLRPGGFPPIPVTRDTISGAAVLDCQTVNVPDTHATDDFLMARRYSDEIGARTSVACPLIHDGVAFGTILARRRGVDPFSEREIAMLETYAQLAATTIQNARLLDEVEAHNRDLAEALEREQATSNVLGIIAGSPTDVQPVLNVICESAARLLKANSANIRLLQDNVLRLGARHGADPSREIDLPLDAEALPVHALLERRTVHLEDPAGRIASEAAWAGPRAILAAPLLAAGVAIGTILVRREAARPYTDRQVALLETFADQAVIAIENVRLFRDLNHRNAELNEALEQQTATGNVLEIIASSPTDIQPVLDTIAESAARLCQSEDVELRLVQDGRLGLAAHFGAIPPRAEPPRVGLESTSGTAVVQRRTVYIPDALADGVPAGTREFAAAYAFRSIMAVPLMREGDALGTLVVRQRSVNAVSARQRTLLETFAAQAVIALENARLFQELEERNRDLSEALEHQTATAEVLDIIASSPTVLEPVLHAIAEKAARVCGATNASIRLVEGDWLVIGAHYGDMTLSIDRVRLDASSAGGRCLLERRVINVPDSLADPRVSEELRTAIRNSPERAVLAAPLRRGSEMVGAILVRKTTVGPFSDKQVALLETFADQAVIAIGNARLFREINERNAELREALEQQTATAEVLRIIGSYPTELQSVLDAVSEKAARLCGASDASVRLLDGDALVVAGRYGELQSRRDRASLMAVDSPSVRSLREQRVIHIADWFSDPEIAESMRTNVTFAAMLCVPLRRGDECIGVIQIRRAKPGPFSDKHIELVETFADQAVIAIENARLFKELQEKNAELAVASQHKSEFLANMSHELRTPLNAIISFSEILQEDAESAGHEEYLADLEEITGAGKHLLGLINDILDLSKIEAGRMDAFLETFELDEVLRELQGVVEPLMARKGNTLVIEAPADLGAMHTDLTKVKQSLLNLLSNAAKFTEQGTITLSVTRDTPLRLGEGQGEGTAPAPAARGEIITFRVTDTGIGMSPEQMGRLFEAFSQADASTTRKYGGTGLGLAITRQFCHMLGGEIAVASEPGIGSTFTITLPADVEQTMSAPDLIDPATHTAPLTPHPDEVAGVGAPVRGGSPMLLAIDDDPAAREVLQRLLRDEPLHIVTATGGQEGLRLARELRPDVITLDVLMPGMDGWSVLAALKKQPATADIPVVMVTVVDQQNVGFALGAAEFLTKPVDRARLVAILNRYCQPASGAILVVDDEPTARDTLRRMLERAGWPVQEAADGWAALEAIRAERPAAVLLDLMMPGMNGFEIVQSLRADAALASLPIVIVTAKELTADERQRLAGSVQRVLQKGSYSQADLLAQVRAAIATKEGDA